MQTTWRKRSESEYDLVDEDREVLAWITQRPDGHWLWFMMEASSSGREETRVAAMRAAERAVGVTI